MRPVRVGNYSIGQYFTLSLSRSAVTKHVLDLPIELTLPGKPHLPSTHHLQDPVGNPVASAWGQKSGSDFWPLCTGFYYCGHYTSNTTSAWQMIHYSYM